VSFFAVPGVRDLSLDDGETRVATHRWITAWMFVIIRAATNVSLVWQREHNGCLRDAALGDSASSPWTFCACGTGSLPSGCDTPGSFLP
jgi:hypothetical protein